MKENIEQTNIKNNQQAIVFLKSKLPDLPDNMKEDWNQIQEILAKSPDITDDQETVWQKSLLELIYNRQKNYEVLTSWQSLLLNISNVDPKYWNWEEYWVHCQEINYDYWGKHATCYYKIAHLKKEREKIANLLLEMFSNEKIKETAKMGSYGIQSVLEIMKNIPLINQEYLKRLEEERLEEFLTWRTNNNINETIDWGNEEKISVVVIKKFIEREKEKLEAELIELKQKKNQGNNTEFENISESAIVEMEVKKADLISQIEKEKSELEQLIEPAKVKLSEEMQDVFEELFKIQTEIIRRGNDFVKGKLEGMKWVLNKKLSAEELQNILDKQAKIIHLEEELATLEKKLNKLTGKTQTFSSEQKEKVKETETEENTDQAKEEKLAQQQSQEVDSEQEKQKLIELFTNELKKYTNEEITAQVVQRAEQQTRYPNK